MATVGKIVDLFCGAGGFSLGARLAGFEIAASIDIDSRLTSSYAVNFPNSKLLLADIKQLSDVELLKHAAIKRDEVTGIVGGPPCQGFSTIGKRNCEDPRNSLIGHFFRLVRVIKPKFFIMENVPGLMASSSKHLINSELADLEGYFVVGPMIIDAQQFGAATQRKRVIVIGYDPKIYSLTEEDVMSITTSKLATVSDAITDIPEPLEGGRSAYRKVKRLSSYAKRARTIPGPGLGDPEHKLLVKAGLVTGLQTTTHTKAVISRLKNTAQGTVDSISRCPRLAWTSAAPTLRAGTGPDRGSFQAIRPIHPESHRVISVREGARIQACPPTSALH